MPCKHLVAGSIPAISSMVSYDDITCCWRSMVTAGNRPATRCTGQWWQTVLKTAGCKNLVGSIPTYTAKNHLLMTKRKKRRLTVGTLIHGCPAVNGRFNSAHPPSVEGVSGAVKAVPANCAFCGKYLPVPPVTSGI